MKKWVCSVCGYVYEGENPPEFCPVCKAPGSKFNEMKGEMPSWPPSTSTASMPRP